MSTPWCEDWLMSWRASLLTFLLAKFFNDNFPLSFDVGFACPNSVHLYTSKVDTHSFCTNLVCACWVPQAPVARTPVQPLPLCLAQGNRFCPRRLLGHSIVRRPADQTFLLHYKKRPLLLITSCFDRFVFEVRRVNGVSWCFGSWRCSVCAPARGGHWPWSHTATRRKAEPNFACEFTRCIKRRECHATFDFHL